MDFPWPKFNPLDIVLKLPICINLTIWSRHGGGKDKQSQHVITPPVFKSHGYQQHRHIHTWCSEYSDRFQRYGTISQIILVHIPYTHQEQKVVCTIKLCQTPIDSPTLVKRTGWQIVFRDTSFREVL